jgi:hypothetical protein
MILHWKVWRSDCCVLGAKHARDRKTLKAASSEQEFVTLAKASIWQRSPHIYDAGFELSPE